MNPNMQQFQQLQNQMQQMVSQAPISIWQTLYPIEYLLTCRIILFIQPQQSVQQKQQSQQSQVRSVIETFTYYE